MGKENDKQVVKTSEQYPKYAFFFGAGTEICFGLPSGAEYIEKSLLTKREKLYDELKEFYENIEQIEECKKYAGTYEKQFLFTKASSTFRKIIERAAQKCLNDYDNEDIDLDSLKIVNLYKLVKLDKEKQTNAILEFNKDCEEVYDYIIQEEDNTEKQDDKRYKSIRENLTYYGTVEKDFSTITDPVKAGKRKFWRLINYFWSAYFSILLPLMDKSDYNENEQYLANKYDFVLDNLVKVSQNLKKKDFIKKIVDETDIEKNYYQILSNHYPDFSVITTNYTSFIEYYWKKEKCAYLAGKLTQFENPMNFQIYDLGKVEDEELPKKELIFPYLSTQAPVKPIVAYEQLFEYFKADKILQAAEYLIVIGYSLGEADNHINALLNHFLRENGKKIIYCGYHKKDEKFCKEIECKKLLTKLKLPEEYRNRVIVVENTGNAKDLYKNLRNCIDGYSIKAKGVNEK